MTKTGAVAVAIMLGAVACSSGPIETSSTSSSASSTACEPPDSTGSGSGSTSAAGAAGASSAGGGAPIDLGTCFDDTNGVPYNAFGTIKATPIVGWAPKDVADLVWQFEDYITSAPTPYAGVSDQVYLLEPVGSGFAWYGVPVHDSTTMSAEDVYKAELADANIKGYWSTMKADPVRAAVVTCTKTTYCNSRVTVTKTHWTKWDPYCGSGACGVVHEP